MANLAVVVLLLVALSPSLCASADTTAVTQTTVNSTETLPTTQAPNVCGSCESLGRLPCETPGSNECGECKTGTVPVHGPGSACVEGNKPPELPDERQPTRRPGDGGGSSGALSPPMIALSVVGALLCVALLFMLRRWTFKRRRQDNYHLGLWMDEEDEDGRIEAVPLSTQRISLDGFDDEEDVVV